MIVISLSDDQLSLKVACYKELEGKIPNDEEM